MKYDPDKFTSLDFITYIIIIIIAIIALIAGVVKGIMEMAALWKYIHS